MNESDYTISSIYEHQISSKLKEQQNRLQLAYFATHGSDLLQLDSSVSFVFKYRNVYRNMCMNHLILEFRYREASNFFFQFGFKLVDRSFKYFKAQCLQVSSVNVPYKFSLVNTRYKLTSIKFIFTLSLIFDLSSLKNTFFPLQAKTAFVVRKVHTKAINLMWNSGTKKKVEQNKCFDCLSLIWRKKPMSTTMIIL